MKTGLLAALFFSLAFTGLISAQDTATPSIMSQRAYDSTLRALKKTTTIIGDTAKPVVKKPVDTVKVKAADTAPVPAKPDIIHNGSIGIIPIMYKDTVKKDTVKIHKIKYRPSGYLALSYGETYTEGDFKLSSYPTKGGDFAFTAAFPGITSHLGMIVEFEYGYNRFDELRYTDSIINRHNDIYLHYSMNGAQKTFYNHETLLLGFYYTYQFKRFSIDARLLGGAMLATIPNETIFINDVSDGNNFTINIYRTTGRAFALDEGISVRYLATPRISVSLGIDNLSAPTSFIMATNEIGSDAYGTATQLPTQINTFILPTHVFTVNLGVGYTIIAKR